jgi:predicted dehydrogenase
VLPPESGDPLAAPHTYVSDFQDDIDVRVYSDYREMLASDVVDGVNDLTTLALHHQVGEVALQAGKHLLTQKPLAISVRAARRLVELAQAKRLTFGTFENVRQSTFVRALAWAVQRGAIGDPQIALMGSLGGFWSPDRVVADTPWRHRKLEGGGGGALDIGVHQFHLLRYVFGEVAWVSGVARTFEPVRYRRDGAGQVIETVPVEVDDTFLAAVGFENGALAQLLWSWAGHGKPLEVPDAPAFYGSQGAVVGRMLSDGKGHETPLLEYFEATLTDEARARFFPMGFTDPYVLQNLDWLNAIAAGRDPETSGEEGLHDLACAFAVLESSAARRQVTLDEVLEGRVNAYQAEIDSYYGL